ncbi:hypothetical protein HKD37_04G009937 [Glycine soja]
METPIDVSESDIPTPLARPMGQKATKRKVKVIGASSSTLIVNLFSIEKEMKERNVVQKQIAKVVELDNVVKMYDILTKEKSNMTEDQHKQYEITCKYILKVSS